MMSDALLRELADDAITVHLWAMQHGLKKDRQIEEVVKAFRMTLARSQKEQAT